MIGLLIRGVSKSFPAPGDSVLKALSAVSLDVAPSEFVVIVGRNGSGKSTLLNLIAGQYLCDSGSIHSIENGIERDWTPLSSSQRGRYIARVHQDPRAGTIDDLTVLENLGLASFRGIPSPFRPSISTRSRVTIERAIERSIIASKSNALAAELSQGQRQLLALEMAIVRGAKLLLLDEHTASLDRENSELCMRRSRELCEITGTTVIMVTHDIAYAAAYGDRLIILQDGVVAAEVSGAQKRSLTIADIVKLCGFTESRNCDDSGNGFPEPAGQGIVSKPRV